MTRRSNNNAINTMCEFTNSLVLPNVAEKTITLAAATTGAIAAHKIFDVDGLVELSIVAICTTDLAGVSGTIEVGTAKDTDSLIATTTATDIDVNEIWHDATPDNSVEAVSATSTTLTAHRLVMQDIAYVVKTTALSAGVVKFIVRWAPISSDGNVTAA